MRMRTREHDHERTVLVVTGAFVLYMICQISDTWTAEGQIIRKIDKMWQE